MASLFLYDETRYTPAQLAQVVREQVEVGYDTLAGNLRTAVMYCPRTMTANEFVAAAVSVGINPGTARNRYSEVRRWQQELGE